MDAPADKTLDDLEWDRLVEAVASRCRGPLGSKLASDGARARLPIATTIEGARVASAQTAECMRLLEAGEALPLDGVRDIGPHLLRVRRGGALEASALREIVTTVAAARAMRKFLHARRAQMPALLEACPFDPSLDALHDELDHAVREDGTLDDRASPTLRDLRREVANLRARIVRQLEAMLVQHDAILQDRFHTLREGRYVLPVRRDAHEKLPGIVHGTSASGATVFVEPRALVERGNRLKMAEAELAREEARILAELTELVLERLASLEVARDALDHADLRQASARLGVDLGARVLPIDDTPSLTLGAARHPILLLDGVDVVANDLAIEAGRGLVLSGPNAGGKTVALKTLGLAALMVRAGLPVPADEDSRGGFFAFVLTDVGDEQSLQKNLSTFSAHVTNLSAILRRVRGAHAYGQGASLVLLDELAGGTDPEEGAALACAVVDALCRAHAAVGVTTHYEPLKAMGGTDERLQNAAVGFDVAAMQPTFAVTVGVPGASSALDVATRFGIPEDVIATARQVLPERSRSVDALVQELEEARRQLALDRAKLDDEAREVAAARAAQRQQDDAERARQQKKSDDEVEKLRSAVRRAREDLRQARRLLKRRQDEPTTRDVKRRIEAAAKVVAEHTRDRTDEPVGQPAEAKDLKPGVKVYVPKLRAEAEILEPPRKGSVRVAAGALRLWVDVDGLRMPAGGGEPSARPAKKAPPKKPDAPRRERGQAPDNTLDVRGLRVEDALAMTTSFLDRLFGESEPTAYILHGIGTGALRDAIRAHLDERKEYVRSFRSGSSREGGDKLTVVTLC